MSTSSTKNPTTGWTTAAAGLLLLMLGAGCSQPVPTTLQVQPTYKGAPVGCGDVLSLDDKRQFRLTDLRLFVHDVRVDGDKVVFASSDVAQPHVALLTPLSAPCPTTALSPQLQLPASVVGKAAKLQLTVGVPFDDNHANPAIAQPPLKGTAMHWSWQAGYKFVRLEGHILDDNGQKTAPARVHIGSTACQGPMSAVSHCDQPNRPRVALDVVVAKDAPLVLQLPLDQLVVPTAGDPKPGCMGGVDDVGCPPVLQAVGLDVRTGQALTTWASTQAASVGRTP